MTLGNRHHDPTILATSAHRHVRAKSRCRGGPGRARAQPAAVVDAGAGCSRAGARREGHWFSPGPGDGGSDGAGGRCLDR